MSDTLVLQATGLGRRFSEGGLDVQVLHDVDLQVRAGETLAVVGASGSGKSTLLHLLGGLDAPTQGRVMLMGQDINAMGLAQQGLFRNEHLGFVYQFHHLLPEFSALDNVAMPLLIRRVKAAEAHAQAQAMLVSVGLGPRAQHRPGELSGGECQRVAIARAIVGDPAIILADEPTGSLDTATGADVLALLSELNARGATIVVVTHNPEIADAIPRTIRLRDGQITHDSEAA
jgi:lipoprotein-releasing system ATP-binding protein